MKKLLRAVVPLLAAVVFVLQSPASALQVNEHNGAGVVTGGGTIGPDGVPPPPTTPATVPAWALSQPCPLTGCAPPAVNTAVTFTGTLGGLFHHYEGPSPATGGAAFVVGSCSFSGGGVDSTLLAVGSVSGTCNGNGPVSSATASCPNRALSYLRVGATVLVTGVCTVTLPNNLLGAGTPTHTLNLGVYGGFAFVPTSTPGAPVTSYALAGAVAGAGGSVVP